jgi:Annexin
MAEHARKAERQDELAPHADVATAPPSSVARILALQASAGNAAVARMVSLLPSAGVARAHAPARTLARLLDYDGLAQRIHDATDRLGTDEVAIVNALRQLNRDPAEVDRLLAAYQSKFGEDMIAVLNSELSGADLQTAMFLLRRAPSPGMQAVAAEMESMVGQQATWTGSGPGSGNTFETWASAASESAAPPLSTVTSINCWEMVLLAAYRAGLLTWQWIHDQYTAAVGDWGTYMVNMLSKGARIPYARGAAAGRQPLAGDLVFMDGMAHVALATGNVDGAGRADVISFWPPPNTPFTRGGTIDSVKHTTIEELVDWWAANMPPAPLVELAAPPWS